MVDLAQNNDRTWFQPRKAEFESLVKEPFEALVGALADRFDERGIPLRADPRRSVFRIYRDTRFSKDKSPYKTHLGASFPWVEGSGLDAEADDSPHGNGGYFHFQPGEMYVGGGMWLAEKPRLDVLRQMIVDHPDRVKASLEDRAFIAEFGPVSSHEQLKRVPPGYPPDHPMADLLRAKDVVFGRHLSDDEVMSPALPDTLANAYQAAMPVLRFLSTLRA